jgi:hypothetical protein
MENGHLHDDKLFRAVHDRLSDYEAPSNGADWDAMSRSLDNLPKTSRFTMKFSLNSILVIVGLLGISALSYAVVSHSGKSSDNKTNSQVTVIEPKAEQPKMNSNPVIPVNNTQAATADPNAFAANNSMDFTNTSTETSLQNNTAMQPQTGISSTDKSSMTNTDGTKKRRNKNQFLFGDQVDPKKGFIYNTQENHDVVTQPVTDPIPGIFYDNVDGKTHKIEIKKDSASTKHSTKPKSDSTAKVNQGAPTGEEQAGFDMED